MTTARKPLSMQEQTTLMSAMRDSTHREGFELLIPTSIPKDLLLDSRFELEGFGISVSSAPRSGPGISSRSTLGHGGRNLKDDSARIRETNRLGSIVCECGNKIPWSESVTGWTQKFVTCSRCHRSGWITSEFMPQRMIEQRKLLENR